MSELKVVKTKQMDEGLTLTIKKDRIGERMYVEFSSETPKLKLQKSFQDTFFGRKDAEKFQKSIKNLGDLKAYFKIQE